MILTVSTYSYPDATCWSVVRGKEVRGKAGYVAKFPTGEKFGSMSCGITEFPKGEIVKRIKDYCEGRGMPMPDIIWQS